MRNKLLAALTGATLGLSLTASAWACNTVEAAVAKIDSKAATLVVNKSMACGSVGTEEMKFALKKETKITVNGKDATLADLRAGDKIKIDYEKLDDVLAVRVTRDS